MGYPVYYVEASDLLPHLFDSFDGGTGASITMTGLAVTDIEIYKDGSATTRSSDNGYVLLDTDGIDFASTTGIHGFSLDLSDDTDSGFYAVGSWYHVVISSITIDGQTVNFVACAFRIVSTTRGLAGTALPDAVSDAPGGLVISDAGSKDFDAMHTAIGTDGTNLTEAGGTGDHLTAINLPNQTMDITGNITGNLSGSAGSVTGAVGSVAGNVDGSVASLTGHTVQTGDSFAVIGALGAGLTDITDRLPAALTKGTADSGSTSTMVDAARTEADTDYWVGGLIRFTSGTITGQVRVITGFTPASDTITFSPVTTQAVATNTYELIPAGDVNRAILVDTTTTNTDVRGTDSAATATALTTAQNDLDTLTGSDGATLATAQGNYAPSTVADLLDKLGAVDEAAAAGDPSSTESVMQYSKQIVNILTGSDGITTMPAAAAPANNVSIAEMVRSIYDDTNVAATAAALATAQTDLDTITGSDGVFIAVSSQPAGWPANLAASAGQIIKGTVDTVTNTHTPLVTEFQADDITEATADHFNGRIVIFTSGVLAGQATDITDYAAVGGIGQFTVTAMTEAPSNNDEFVVV